MALWWATLERMQYTTTLNCAAILGAFMGLMTPAREAFAVSVEDVPNPRTMGGWVSDTIGVIDPVPESHLNQSIAGVERDLGVEIAVVTVESVDTATPKDFATELFNYWGIGKASSNNGLLVLLVRSERRLEMETGYGTEAVLTDGWLKSMQQAEMIPHFKNGDFGLGLTKGVEASIARLRKYPDGIPEGVDDDYPSDSDFPWWYIVLGVGGVAGAGGGWRWKWKRDRTCDECGKMMTMLPEDEDDVHLDEGQETEEALGSVDYQFWYCETCETDRLLTVNKWFSGFSKCPGCGYKTCSSQSNTVSAATYSSTGLREVIRDCSHCGYHRRTTHVIPRKTRSSSSSSYGGSSGGSFGGGSSGGGGAGSSW
jgi:uncharacterized protein